jgi:hypothetical protein
MGTTSEVGDAGVGQVATEPQVYGCLVDRPARSPAIEQIVAVLGAGWAAVVYASRVAVSRPVIGTVLPSPFVESRIRSVPARLSTSGRVRLSASETLSPAS